MPTKLKEEALLHRDKDLTTWHKKMKIWQDTRRYSTSEDELTYANTWMNSTENNPSNLSKDVPVDLTLIVRSGHSSEIFSSYTYAINLKLLHQLGLKLSHSHRLPAQQGNNNTHRPFKSLWSNKNTTQIIFVWWLIIIRQ